MGAKKLELIEPTASLQEEYLAYCGEFGCADIPGNCSMTTAEGFLEGVQRCLDHARGHNLPLGWVPAHTFWLIRDGEILLGMINLRHALTPFLEHEGGHIGYSVRPSEQGKGYATRMLTLTLEKALQIGMRRVLITCDKKNVASARVIQKCSGILENEVASAPPERETTQRYWIAL